MEHNLRWLPTKEATSYLGVSPQFLKKNRDIYGGFLKEEIHYILGANINSSILWNVREISNNIDFSEQHTRRILRHLFSEEMIIREDQKIKNGRPNHLYGSKIS